MRSWVAVFVGFLAVALAAVGLVAVDAPTAPAADDPDGAIAVAADEGPGYWLVDETGVVYAFGRAQHHGDVSPGAGVTAVDRARDLAAGCLADPVDALAIRPVGGGRHCLLDVEPDRVLAIRPDPCGVQVDVPEPLVARRLFGAAERTLEPRRDATDA